jgi:hypothetical protein
LEAAFLGADFLTGASWRGFRGGSFPLGEDFFAGFFRACGFGATFFATSAGVTGGPGCTGVAGLTGAAAGSGARP